ncbi:hypothetical protein [Streptomyces alboflavus]|uniref:hypothetical protein n=1 Tax=Streptomyces alboflavus TaxID=67267 RepID=UPI00068FDE07|nr:hypothetical protein [Streptomyces alboflavus]
MRTSVPHLALTLTTAALCTLAAAPSAYAGDATAEVTPTHLAPGEQITVSVSCPDTGGTPPQTMTASSQAFEQGSVQLHRVQTGQGLPDERQHEQADPYGLTDPQGTDPQGLEPDSEPGLEPDLGTMPGEEFDPGTGTDMGSGTDMGAGTGTGTDTGVGDEAGIRGDAENAANGDAAANGDDGANGDDAGNHDDGANSGGAGVAYQGTARIAAAASFEGGGPNAVGPESQWAVDGACHDDGRWKATFTVTRTAHTPTHRPTHTPTHTAPAAHGVHAGRDGGFTDSPAALAAGGLLVSGALGAAVHRLRRDRTSAR